MTTTTDLQQVQVADWGNIEYGEAWNRQEAVLAEGLRRKREGGEPVQHHLFLCSHPHVYTLGKSGHIENLLLADARLQAIGAAFYRTNRGGDITYHGPGQIVGYPMLDLEQFFTDIGRYMRALEDVIIRTIAHWGIAGDRLPGSTGVWIDAADQTRARKICAMGVRCSRWLTMHGFALNVNTDLSYFGHIVPCGIADKGVTSMAAELGAPVDEQEVKAVLLREFASVFDAVLS